VIQQFDAYDFTRRFELGGDVDVALRWFNTTAGVIVRDNDSRSPVGQCILEGNVLERLGHDPLGIEHLLIRFGHYRAMHVVERLIGNDAGRHIHDVAFGDIQLVSFPCGFCSFVNPIAHIFITIIINPIINRVSDYVATFLEIPVIKGILTFDAILFIQIFNVMDKYPQ
jgi:hypothetical protein